MQAKADHVGEDGRPPAGKAGVEPVPVAAAAESSEDAMKRFDWAPLALTFVILIIGLAAALAKHHHWRERHETHAPGAGIARPVELAEPD